MAVTKTSFDAAKHLEKQGWKGKGTALKNGHATRPLAVVQKKTLSGIGKDRDEAVPFWDHIFAATAANLFTPSASSSPAPASSSKWATLTPATISGIPQSGSSSSSPAPPKQRLSISAQTRVSREMARRQLYSRFLRGKVFIPDDEVEIQESEEEWSKSKATEIKAVVERGIDGSSNADKSERKGKKSKGDGKEETQEEMNARRAEKKAKGAKEGKKSKKKDKGKQKEEKGEEMKEKKGKKEKEKKEKEKGSKSQKADEENERKRKDKSVDERIDGVEKMKKKKKRKCLESDDEVHKRKTSKG
ncbi:hypothetical protein I308_106439 [Cryptococcus tetragattii IND107]|uniref:G-patch domain-containing protein n=1 Tax=Cryptococcus tetragattii IND107 TaxID=1296105 RepID=A0ABR3BK36_9TREE|nr:hypothetical protein I308_05383 [Cryptococcus tetragattii IND107]